MKESVLWRRLDRAVGTRLRARYKNKESGVAMVMALMFILVVLLTSTLLLGILLSQALPYRNNARNAQGKVAAEAGLQAGLSFLRTAESYYESGNYSKLMPATAADPSKPSLDETYAMETATTSGSTTGTVKVVALNYVPVDDTSSGTTAVSTSSATHNQKLSYRIQIGYYDGDPDAGGKMVTDATKLSSVKYAVVVSYGYVNRYPDGRTSGTEADPVRAAAAKYKFGQSVELPPPPSNTKTSAAFHALSPTQSAWVVVDSETTDANGDVETITTKGGPGQYLSDDNLQYATDDPRNSICMVAATDLQGNVDSTKMPVEGSPIRLFKMYTSSGDHTVYTASEYCKPNGAYKNLNKWVYGKDDSIRLSGTDLCVTGLSTDYNVKGGINRNGAATLTTCGTSYTTTRKVVPGVDIGYDASAEVSDANSLLNKYQKWAFYYGFVNAGYLNFGKTNTSDASTKYFSRGPIRGSSHDYSHTLFQNLYAVKIRYANINNASQEWDRCDTDNNDNQYEGDNSCFLISSKWKTYLYANGAYDLGSRTYAETLGNGGEAGWETNQIVNAGSGACMQAQYGGTINNNNTIAFQCYVNAAPLRPYCHADTVARGDAGSTGASSVDCPVVEDSSISGDDPKNAGNYLWSSNNGSWKNDIISYTKGTDGKSGTLTNLQVRDNDSSGCLTADSASDGSAIHAIKNTCSTMAQFYRYEKVDGSGLFDYKFVLASTMPAPNNPTASANPNALCITEVDPGSYGYSKPDGAYSNVMLKKCTDNTAVNRYGITNNSSQQWNGVSSPDNPGGGAGGYNETVAKTISYASSKYVDAANWKW